MERLTAKDIIQASKLKADSGLDSKAVRTFLNEATNEEISEILQYKEKTIPFLFNLKASSKALMESLVADDPQQLALWLIHYNLTPDKDLAVNILLSVSDAVGMKFVSTFNTIPFDVPDVLTLLNTDNPNKETIGAMVDARKLKATELLILLIKAGICSDLIIEETKANGAIQLAVLNEYFKNYYSNEEAVSKEIVILAIERSQSLREISNSHKISRLEDDMSDAAYANVVRQLGASSGYYGYRSLTLTYRSLLEDPEFSSSPHKWSGLSLRNVPKTSKHYNMYLIDNPDLVRFENLDVLKNTSDRKFKERAIRAVLENISSSELKEMSVEHITILGPKTLRDAIRSAKMSEADIKIIFDKLKTPYKKELAYLLPNEENIKPEKTRQSSFFAEALQALKISDIHGFRKYTNMPSYNLTKFTQDTYQSSKSRSCEISYVSGKALGLLSKEEILGLCGSKIPFSSWDFDENVKHKFTFYECKILSNKIPYSEMFLTCSEPLVFLENINESQLLKVYLKEQNKKAIFKDKKLKSVLITRFENLKNSHRNDYSEDAIIEIIPFLSLEAAKKIVPKTTEAFPVKAKNGEYVFSIAEVFEIIPYNLSRGAVDTYRHLAERDKKLASEFGEAFKVGNKALNALFTKYTGKASNLNIRRDKSDIEAIAALTDSEGEKKSEEQIVKDISSRGSAWSEFKRCFGKDAKSVLARYPKIRVKAGVDDLSSMPPNAKAKIRLNRADSSMLKSVVDAVNGGMDVIVERLTTGRDADIQSIVEFMKAVKCKDFHFEYNESRIKLALVVSGALPTGELEKIDFERCYTLFDMKNLDAANVVFSEELMESLILQTDEEGIRWLAEKKPRSLGVRLNESEYCVKEKTKLLKKLGFNIVSEAEHKNRASYKLISENPTGFSPIDLSRMGTQEKILIINHAVKLDPRLGKIGILGMNLENVDTLMNYNEMKDVVSLAHEDLVRILNIPSNLASNKKFMKGVEKFCAINPSVVMKFASIRNSLQEITNGKDELTLSDALDYSDQSNIFEKPEFTGIHSSNAHVLIFRLRDNPVGLFKGMSKPEVMRLLRDLGSYKTNFLEDCFRMAIRASNGLEDLKERLKSDLTDEEKASYQSVIDSVARRLSEISEIKDLKHVHERLVVVSDFIKQDAAQPLRQDKYREIEKDQKFIDEFGYPVLFPKTRGELVEMGNQHGWCVNNSPSYGNGVIEDGNILVGICSPGKDPCIETLIALAHFENNGGNYVLEQLRVSAKVGDKFEDASSKYDHKALLSRILKVVREEEKKLKSAKNKQEKIGEEAA